MPVRVKPTATEGARSAEVSESITTMSAHRISLRSAHITERDALDGLQRHASMHESMYRSQLARHPDTIDLPVEQIAAGLVRVAEQRLSSTVPALTDEENAYGLRSERPLAALGPSELPRSRSLHNRLVS